MILKPTYAQRLLAIRQFKLPSLSTHQKSNIHAEAGLQDEGRVSRPHEVFRLFSEIAPLRDLRRQFYKTDERVGFVPTMGALHEGHLNLVRHALRENNQVFISIFVNPTQFGVSEDLDSYPKTFEEDVHKLASVQHEMQKQPNVFGQRPQITGIFAPKINVMYPTLPPSSEINGDGSFVIISPLGKWYEGASRPVFFRGVATVCMKLFNIVQPDQVYFGQKDIQQSVLIKRMVKDFHIPTTVNVMPTSREPDGLAMSSRNVYLGERRRKDSTILYKALKAAQNLYESLPATNTETKGISAAQLRKAALEVFEQDLRRKGDALFGSGKIEVDYIAVSEIDDMQEIKNHQIVNPRKGAILSAAIKVHPVEDPANDQEQSQKTVRLIDNIILEPR